jgi:hypothetical protein
MITGLRPAKGSRLGPFPAFLGIVVALYAATVVLVEASVARGGTESPFEKLLVARDEVIDWIAPGASHAVHLAYGDMPARLETDTGQMMMVLAEVGSGPLHNLFTVEQAIRELAVRHILYLIDAFAFASAAWNE